MSGSKGLSVSASAEGVNRRLVDALLATAMTLAIAVVIASDFEKTGRREPGAYLFALGFGALVLTRRRVPRLMVMLTVLGIFAYYILKFPPIGSVLPAVAALYCAADAGRTGWAIGGGLVLIAVSAWARVGDGLPASYLLSYELLTNIALAAAAIALGVSVRLRRQARVAQQQLLASQAAQQAQQAEHRLQVERMVIARDLHDTVGHTMATIALHANVAAEAIGRDDSAIRRAVEEIRDTAGATIRELRATVKILRSPGGDLERGAVGLSGVPRLVDSAREAGLDVELDLNVPEGRLDGAIDAAGYRIVQESLTNVIRHSGARRARVAAGVDDGWLEIVVADDGRGYDSAGRTPSGAGLLGMQERTALLGGQFSAGDGDGGFVVRAALPTRVGG